MNYEKAYKDALERAKKGECLENIFPEFKDEKMRKMAIKAVHAPEAQSCIKSWGVNPDDVIAWLEKQGAQKPIISNNALREGIAHFGITQYQIDNWLKKYIDVEKQDELQYWKPSKEQLEALDYAYNSCPDTERGNYYEGVLRTLIDDLYKLQEKQSNQKSTKNIMNVWKDMRLEVYQQASGNRHEPNYSDDTTKMFSLNDIDEIIEKVSEQKTADKIEPKFKIGDWIINNDKRIAAPTQILKIEKYGYVTSSGYISFDKVKTDYHLWTIQDAKDGDVLVDNYAIIIFRKIGNYVLDDVVDFYICYSFEKGIIIQRHNLHCGFIDSVFFKPATKEQRDMFFQKMHEAGYEWDFEVKELNKIEKKPADKAQPKFKVGDWITNSIETVQITGYDIDYGYQVDYKGNLQHRDTDIIEKEYHLWSIQDAKDGDVLYTTCGGKNKMIFIYNGIDIDSVCCYCLYSITGIKYEMFNTVCHIKSDICPATKEQRDTLMKAIADAGN